MVNICDVTLGEFQANIKNKELIIWGAGYRCEKICEIIEKEPIFVVDSDVMKQNTFININGNSVQIVSKDGLIEIIKRSKHREFALFISTAFYVEQILDIVSQEPALDGMDCYIYNLINDKCSDVSFSFLDIEKNIPKTIHYCWFGGKVIPSQLQKCVDSWKKYCPDYEIVRWDENNYDISKNQYMREAYEKKQWGFVVDYARLDIVYKYGGFYLDTDVELISSLEPLRAGNMFCAFFNETTIAFGAGVGAKKGHKLILEMRDIYEDYNFIDEKGEMNRRTCTFYQNQVLKKHGFKMTNNFQIKDDVIVYPTGIILSRDYTNRQKITEKTIAIHHGAGSWRTDDEKKHVALFKGKE